METEVLEKVVQNTVAQDLVEGSYSDVSEYDEQSDLERLSDLLHSGNHVKELNDLASAQAVGGHGDVVKIDNDHLFKAVNPAERDFYGMLEDGYHEDLRGIAPEISSADGFPEFFKARPDLLERDGVVMRSVKAGMGENAKMMDIKIGPKTVSYKELREGGKGKRAAWWKKRKLRAADWYTKSSARGFRVVGYDGSGGKSRSEIARDQPEGTFDTFFDKDDPAKQQAAERVGEIRQAIAGRPELAFIGASILIGYDPDGRNLQVNLIDFGHAMEKNGNQAHDEMVDKYHQRFLTGLENLEKRLAPGDGEEQLEEL